MIVNLGHEAELRRQYGFPSVAPLWGPSARCHWKRKHGPSDAEIRELERTPDVALRRLGLTGLKCSALIDDLLAHSKFGAAMSLAGYIASIPSLAGASTREHGDFDLESLVFLRLKEAQAAIEGGYYTRARSLMVQLEAMTRALPHGVASDLVRANVAMLWARLLQLLWLTQKSLEFLELSATAFGRTRWGVPAGFRMLQVRSTLRGAVRDDLERERLSLLEGHSAATSIFGGLATHYSSYLRARAALSTQDWVTAQRLFRNAMQSMVRHGHRGIPDPIRLAYTTLGLGQAIVGEGRDFNNAARVDEGLRLILQAQWRFEHENNLHGEYLAHRGYSEASAHGPDLEDEATLRSLKADYRLSLRSQVPRFQLESGLAYANALYKYGRPNRVVVLVREMKHIADDPLAGELVTEPEWARVIALEKKTSDARDNGVNPLSNWGISPHAQREGDYVRNVTRSGALVTIFGPAGSGRRLLVSRIASARGESPPAVLDARMRSSVLEDLTKHRSLGTPVILHNLDLWDERVQVEVLDAVRGVNAWPASVYVTLRKSSAKDSQLGDRQSPDLTRELLAGAFEISPLASRPEDTLLLARGYLVRALAERKMRLRRGRFDPKSVVFTGAACQYIRERYSEIRTLSRHMRDLALRIKDRDFIMGRDDRRRIPVEVIRRILDVPSRVMGAAVQEGARSLKQEPASIAGLNLLTANESELLAVSRRLNGKISKAAREYGIPPSTFRKSLQDRELLEVWNQGRSRKMPMN